MEIVHNRCIYLKIYEKIQYRKSMAIPFFLLTFLYFYNLEEKTPSIFCLQIK